MPLALPEQLAALVEELSRVWELDSGPEPVRAAPEGDGCEDSVFDVPVRRRGVPGPAGAALLRVRHPVPEAGTPAGEEHLVLRRWAGVGAVRLLAADPPRGALLLERPAGPDLSGIDILEACEILGTLIRSLATPAPAPISTVAEALLATAARLTPTDALPRRLVDEARAAALTLAIDVPDPGAVVVTDLGFDTVMTSARAPMLSITGSALAGDLSFAVAPAVLGRVADAQRAHRLRTHLRLRLDVVCDVAGLDPARARALTLIRQVDRLVALTSAAAPDPAAITWGIAVAKALQG